MKDGMLLEPRSAPMLDESRALPEIADVYKWAFEQAAHLRAGRFDQLDIENMADEIEDVGRSEYNALQSDLSIVLLHMLKWDYQPHRRSRSWEASIGEHRERVSNRLEDSPSMKTKQTEAITRAYGLARKRASGETDLALSVFPIGCPYSWSDIMDTAYELEERS